MTADITYNNLGESGLKIAPIIVGCMSYGSKSWADWVIEDEEEVLKILKKCYDVGLRTFDTANVYSNGRSEELLGKFLKRFNIPRDRVVILSKVFGPVNTEDPNFRLGTVGNYPAVDWYNSKGLSRKHIFDAVKGIQQRLGTYVDVLQIHRLDHDTPKKEIMKTLNDIVDQGYTRYIGASSMKAVEFAQLQFIAEQNGWHKFISMQNYYNLIYREEEREMIPFCQKGDFGNVGVIPWSPIARGVLARPIGGPSGTGRDKTDNFLKALDLDKLPEEEREIVKRVEEIAEKRGVSMAVVATAWVISKGTNPIVGLSSVARVDDILGATRLTLTPEESKYLEEPYKPKAAMF
ncbi:putative aryl-alcohol dehydrogenase AAD16 [Spathaspora sp. JA1]|nr:putative aryl-alcohol dehydrogenase AAD16 [Spathaspora sp. JA1]